MRRRRQVAQATLEFAVVAPLFLLCLFGAVDAGLWALENGAEVSAVEQAARAAAAAPASPLSESAPDARMVAALIAPRLQQGLFATRVVPWCGRSPAGSCGAAAGCPTGPADVQAAFGPRVVAVCVEQRSPPPCPAPPAVATPGCGDSPMVTVRIVGFVAALVPPGFGLGSQAGEIGTDVAATTHTLRFAP